MMMIMISRERLKDMMWCVESTEKKYSRIRRFATLNRKRNTARAIQYWWYVKVHRCLMSPIIFHMVEDSDRGPEKTGTAY